MAYEIGEKVKLTGKRGGWEGIIRDRFGGPAGRHYYVVQPSPASQAEIGRSTVTDPEIAQGGLPLQAFDFGDSVSIGSWDAEVTARVRWRYGKPVRVTPFGLQPFGPRIASSSFEGESFEVTIKESVNPRLLRDRRHLIPRWRLVLMND